MPTIASGAYIDALLRLVRKEKVDLLVPLLDLELPLLAVTADRFADLGCCALISAPSVVRTCRDKIATYRALTEAGIDTPATWPCCRAYRPNPFRSTGVAGKSAGPTSK